MSNAEQTTTNAAETANVAKKRVKKPSVPMERFIEVHEACNSINEVAKTLNLSPTAVYNRAGHYRKEGIQLKEFTRQPTRRINVEQANAFIAKLREAEEAAAKQ